VQYGLIILGNAGVGKSFLANCLLGNNHFQHDFSATAVTIKTEFAEVIIQGDTYAIFNIPGLIEADQERIDLNKKEIEKAFKERPNCIIVYVFGHQNGRVRNEDVVAFNALYDSYEFKEGSFVIVFNGIPTRRPKDYEGKTMVLLKRLIKVDFSENELCFLDHINSESAQERESLRDHFLVVLHHHTAKNHVKVRDIHVLAPEIEILKKELEQRQIQFNAMMENFRQVIENQQKNNKSYDGSTKHRNC